MWRKGRKEGGRLGERDLGTERDECVDYRMFTFGGRGRREERCEGMTHARRGGGGMEGRREGKRAHSEKGNGNTHGSKRESRPCVLTRPWTSSYLSFSLPPRLPFHSPPVSRAVCQTQRKEGGREGGEREGP